MHIRLSLPGTKSGNFTSKTAFFKHDCAQFFDRNRSFFQKSAFSLENQFYNSFLQG